MRDVFMIKTCDTKAPAVFWFEKHIGMLHSVPGGSDSVQAVRHQERIGGSSRSGSHVGSGQEVERKKTKTSVVFHFEALTGRWLAGGPSGVQVSGTGISETSTDDR
ncbi:hypothetical protein RSOLAG22IIIB_06433 [Rhizoctonia solani]|uniref:Uncharacterized protein n=1 Tax=Rhizoctonia solani TaxID=456999 RepID=A0A0K6GEV2_9AGAM|nr:hypothetical protein RSOLAG22IIIB_06433 [Rhizoctonia solani]